VIIDNDSGSKVTITSLVDSVWGSPDCKSTSTGRSAVGIELDPDDGDGGDVRNVDPNGPDALSCTYEVTAPPSGEVKNVVTVTVQSPDGQTGTDVDDNTKVTITS